MVSVRTDSAEEMVAITIRDTGDGIPSHLLDKVCEPFFSTKPEGMRGMGLAIVRDIIKAHGGRMDIESTLGGGTSVLLFLPLLKKKPA